MERYVFAVRNQAFCVWGHDLAQWNDLFLRSYDPDYFSYLTTLHTAQLEGDNGATAAVALRTGYHHGLETLFSLLCALSQAPGCVAAWIPKCTNPVLRNLVGDIASGRLILTQRGRQPLSWEVLSGIVHSHVWQDETPPAATAARYANLWARFAADFLDDSHVVEYNSIKHGFRVSSGPFVLRVGLEHSYGVPPADSEMQTIGASPHGTTFYVPEPIPRTSRGTPHFWLRKNRLNWRAEAMAQALQLLSCSITNVVGGLRVLNGAKPSTVLFKRPEDPAAFEAPWGWHVGVISGGFDIAVEESEVRCLPRDELLAELESRASAA